MIERVYTLLCPFGGLGAGALGFIEAETRLFETRARFKLLGGLDVDPAACADFEYLTGVPEWCADVWNVTPEELRARFGEKGPDVVFMSPPCLPGAEHVITPEGPRPIETIRAGDEVLTHRGRYRRVAKVGTHVYSGFIYGLRLHGTVDSREFTAEHPIRVRRPYRPVVAGKQVHGRMRAPKFIPASDVRVGDRVGFPIEKEAIGCALAYVCSFGDPQVIEKGGGSTGRYAKPAHRAKITRIADLRQHAESSALWFLLGAYLGDGYLVPRKNETNFCVGGEHSPLAVNVRDALTVLGLGWSTDRSAGGSNVKIRVPSRHLATLAATFGSGAENKDIPAELMSLERVPLDALIRGLRATDGSERPARRDTRGKFFSAAWKVVSVSLPLLRSVQRLLLRRGEFGAIHKAWPGGPQTIMGRTVDTLPRWEIKVSERTRRGVHEFADDAIWIRVRAISERGGEDHQERVWNLEVEEDDTFCVPMMATHNCKGSSRLLSDAKAKTAKYRKLNKLALRWVAIMLEAWADSPPRLVLLENVPGVTTRAARMLQAVRGHLRRAGYVMHDGVHDAGEIGGLAQRRRRFLLVARHQKSVPSLLYQPVKKRVRACGEVLGPLPIPNDPAGGPMHRLPQIGWLNWVRLALIPAGGDWRDLPGVLDEGQKRRDVFKRHAVEDWSAATGTVGGSGSNGVENVADPRPGDSMGFFGGTYGVAPWSEPSGAVTGRSGVSTGSFSVADPRVGTAKSGANYSKNIPARGPGLGCKPRAGAYGVSDWKKPAKAVTGATSIDAAEIAVADPRMRERSSTAERKHTGDAHQDVSVIPQRENANMHENKYQVRAWDEAMGTVTGASRPGSGAQGVADPRGPAWFGNVLRIVPWGEPAAAVTSGTGPTNGGGAVADPRFSDLDREGKSISDAPRFGRNVSKRRPRCENVHLPAETSTSDPRLNDFASGGKSDPRVKVAFDHGYKVTAWADASDTIAAGSHPGQGAYSVQDPRVEKAALVGIVTLDDARATVTGGIPCPFAIVDPSVDGAPFMVIHDVKKAPPAAPVILAADGTWHRPLTLLEKAVLQGLPAIHNGAPLQLAGTSSSQSERVGNAVPLQAATAIAEQMLLTLLSSDLGAFALSSGGSVWVTPPAGASFQ